MNYKANSPEDYIKQLPAERQEPVAKLRAIISKNLPKGFQEQMSYGMPGFVVPHSIYPDGYHCDTKLPLPFISIASQKNFVALYHSGIYADTELHLIGELCTKMTVEKWVAMYEKNVKNR